MLTSFPFFQYFTRCCTPNSDTPGADAPPLRPPHKAIGTVFYNCGNTRRGLTFALSGYLQQGGAGRGENPSCQNNEFNNFNRYEVVNRAKKIEDF